MSKTVKIKVVIDTPFVGGTITDYEEVDREDWDEMTEKERNDLLDDLAKDYLENNIGYWAEVVEE